MRVVLDIEEWEDSPIFPERYEVSNLGKVRNKPYLKTTRNINGTLTFLTTSKILKHSLDGSGYPQVVLCKDGKRITRKVHRLVAIAFIPNPEGKPTVNHKDSDRCNNVIANLEWATQKEQVRHSFDYGNKSCVGEKHPSAVLSERVVVEIRELRKSGLTCAQISEELGFKYHTVHKVLSGKNWSHVREE